MSRVLTLFEKVRTSIDELLLPKGLTPELEKKILERFQQKYEEQKRKYGFIPKSHYSMTVDVCLREAMHELMPKGVDRRPIQYYLLRKIKK